MIKTIQINNEKWNDYVKKVPNYDVFYLKEYVFSFMKENRENGEPLLIIYENGEDYAINVVFRRDISETEYFDGKLEKGKYFDLISPYGYGGFLGNVSDYKKVDLEYEEYCRQSGYICEFVRFELFSDYYRFFAGEVETRTHNVIRDLDMGLDDIWMDFKQKVRKNVKRATKSGLEIVVDESGKYLDEFLNIYYGTMERTKAESQFFFSRAFFERLNQMHGNYVYFHVKYKEKIISTELVIYGADTCYSYLGGTNKDFFDLRPNDFLKYEIIKWAKKKGMKRFVLGGGYGQDDGIYQYKVCLAPKGIVDFYIGRRIFDQENYQMLVDLRIENGNTDLKQEYFPKYRS